MNFTKHIYHTFCKDIKLISIENYLCICSLITRRTMTVYHLSSVYLFMYIQLLPTTTIYEVLVTPDIN